MCLPLVDCGNPQVCPNVQAESLHSHKMLVLLAVDATVSIRERRDADKIYLENCLRTRRLFFSSLHDHTSLCDFGSFLMLIIQHFSGGAHLKEAKQCEPEK